MSFHAQVISPGGGCSSKACGDTALVCRNPAHADVFVSCSGDNTAKVWDARQPRATLTIPAHQHEVGMASDELCLKDSPLPGGLQCRTGMCTRQDGRVCCPSCKSRQPLDVVCHAHSVLRKP